MTSETKQPVEETVQEINGLKRAADVAESESEKKVLKTDAKTGEAAEAKPEERKSDEAQPQPTVDKGKEKVRGKGKSRYESEPEDEEDGEEEEDDEEENDETYENDLNEEEEDSLEEIDTTNIMPSRTRRKVIDYKKTLEEMEAQNQVNGEDEEDDADFKAPEEESISE